MANITWLSNAPWTSTGYGTQTRLIVDRLFDMGHHLAVDAFYGLEGGILTWGKGVRVYPKGNHPYGSDVLDADAQHFASTYPNDPTIAVAFLDSWVVEPQMIKNVPLAFYYPVDHDPLPRVIRDRVKQGAFRINYSKFGQRMTEDAGLDTYYVPHCVDTQLYKPTPQAVARAKVIAQTPAGKNSHLAQDAFVVGMVAANKGNPSRKCFQQQLEAFKELHRRHPDTQLYLHCVKGQEASGVNLVELVEHLGLTDCTFFVEQYMHHLGLPDTYVNDVYNCFDVLTNVSMGEGFGLPILEAQSAGTPVVTGDWTSMSEITFAGWKIDRADADAYWTPLASYQFVPRIGAIVEAYEQAYKDAGNARLHKQARQGALAYDADDVVRNMWGPVIDDMAAKVEERNAARAMLLGAATPEAAA